MKGSKIANIKLTEELTIQTTIADDGEHYISSVVANELLAFDARQDHATRSLKAILGKELTLAKISVPGTRFSATHLTLKQFDLLLSELAFSGNKKAQEITRALAGTMLWVLSCDAHGVEHNLEQRKIRYEERMQHKKQFHPLFTSWLKIDANGDSSAVNWGREVNLLKHYAKAPMKPLDGYTKEELHLINKAEIVYDAMRRAGLNHEQSLRNI